MIPKTNSQAEDTAPSDCAEYLFVQDLREMFKVGQSKARLMMSVLPSVRIGQSDCVLRTDLDAYLAEHGGIKVKWPKQRR